MKSGLEEDTFDYLRRFSRQGKFQAKYESEKLHYVIEADYKPDFIVTFEDGRKIYIETKGLFDHVDRRKMIAVKKMHPEKDIRLAFAKDNKLTPHSVTRYTEWATRNGFPNCVGRIPLEWLGIAPDDSIRPDDTET